MKTIYSKEDFNRRFPKGMRTSKENLRRVAANQLLCKGVSLQETHELVLKQLP